MVTSAEIEAIEGWFLPTDIQAFRVLLEASATLYPSGGDLAELGAYFGKSAVLIGAYLRPGETFTVIDLFEQGASDEANARENAEQYPTLTRAAFENNYLSVHPALPVVVTGYSQSITEHATPGTHRFVHIDASHLYEHVVGDLDAVKQLLVPDGIVVLDDIRSEHTPGVAAAAWRCEGLRPFLLTGQKMYATWGDPEPWKAAVRQWLSTSGIDEHEVQHVGADEVIRVWSKSGHESRLKAYVPPAMLPGLRRLRDRLKR